MLHELNVVLTEMPNDSAYYELNTNHLGRSYIGFCWNDNGWIREVSFSDLDAIEYFKQYAKATRGEFRPGTVYGINREQFIELKREYERYLSL